MSKLTLESTCSSESTLRPSTPSGLSISDLESQNNANCSLEEIQSKNSSSIETHPVVVIRRAYKSYGSKKDANIVLHDLNITIGQGTM